LCVETADQSARVKTTRWCCLLENSFEKSSPPPVDRGSTVVKGAVLKIGRLLVRSQMVSLELFIDIKSFRSHYGPWVDSASNRNEYQEYFLGVKAAGA